jgi:hypothetical protein
MDPVESPLVLQSFVSLWGRGADDLGLAREQGCPDEPPAEEGQQLKTIPRSRYRELQPCRHTEKELSHMAQKERIAERIAALEAGWVYVSSLSTSAEHDTARLTPSQVFERYSKRLA